MGLVIVLLAGADLRAEAEVSSGKCPRWECRQKRRCVCTPAQKIELEERLRALSTVEESHASANREDSSAAESAEIHSPAQKRRLGYIGQFPPGF